MIVSGGGGDTRQGELIPAVVEGGISDSVATDAPDRSAVVLEDAVGDVAVFSIATRREGHAQACCAYCSSGCYVVGYCYIIFTTFDFDFNRKYICVVGAD